jgi:hypothetical protein
MSINLGRYRYIQDCTALSSIIYISGKQGVA